ncbi:MAG: group II intron reverse transcriptase/maturase [Selenomonadaceae bacterium]|nr:group II intron reverse transcriptase/maturase [Selenomonadaceae bacterium]
MPHQKRGKPKVSDIRYGEYYDLQKTFDRLYRQSLEDNNFYGLMNIISSSENIMLAVRTIRSNEGSRTPGTDGRTMKHLLKMDREKFVALIQKQMGNYKPHSVRRVEIPKANGGKRPLGIPAIVDRVIQQCVKQVLEPICEAKFYYHSYGFRPDRSAENAIARCMQLMQNANMHYVVDVDIKGFFDNIWHSKLIRQLWNMGIRDKKLLSIVRTMLKAPIQLPNGEIEIPAKGTPQGGILSPLLANVVLNELDQWISSQWETFPMHNPYKPYYRKNGVKDNSSQYKRLRETSKLKNIFIVRYADDFKIFCRNINDANKTYYAVTKWLKERLHLEISQEKSKVINLHNKYSEFLGFKLKVHKKSKAEKVKWTVVSHISDKVKEKAIQNIKSSFKKIVDTNGEMKQYQAISKYNALIMGLHNYYHLATMVSEDFNKIEWKTGRQVKHQLKRQGATKSLTGSGKDGKVKDEIEKRYGKSKRVWYLRGHIIVPVGYVQTQTALSRDRGINRYTEEGRKKRHENLEIETWIMLWLMRNPTKGSSVEYADNRIAVYTVQKGKCAVTGAELKIGEIHCHHIKPRSKGGTDNYKNLILITETVHKLIHATKEDTIQRHLEVINLNAKQMLKINELRKEAGLKSIA